MSSLLLYISAAGDLAAERDLLARAVTEIPVSLGWRIVLSPLRHEPVDRSAVIEADVHLLLLGSDIRAPIGLEWNLARHADRLPIAFLKHEILRTPAAEAFASYVEGHTVWRPFGTGADLRRSVLSLLGDHILSRAVEYRLPLPELERVQAWRAHLDTSPQVASEGGPGGAGESSIIFSGAQLASAGGILIRPKDPEGR